MLDTSATAADSSSSSVSSSYRQQQSFTSSVAGSTLHQQQPTRFRGPTGSEVLVPNTTSSSSQDYYNNNNCYSPTDKKPTSGSSHSSIYLFVILIIVAATVLAVPFLLKTLPFQTRSHITDKPTAEIHQQNHNYQLTTPRPHEKLPPPQQQYKAVTQMGLEKLGIEILKAGSSSAQAVVRSNKVTVHALGSVLEVGGGKTKFWSTRDAGQQPFKYTAGVGEVITGWDQGVLGMAQGEVRGISIPGNQGYGAQGFPAWGIPPNADLHFEIEVLSIDNTTTK
eukprot:GHVS01014102.1.p1 GENE.GHVS01014102.1~~GHVS01014102.1.p1  ORF type:complete len:280 (-),score=61.05 GHVS01014102.1:1052-1891(-)